MKKDFFSEQSAYYARYRPVYPPELYTCISSLCKQHSCAWDVATGNGQAAVALSHLFQEVYASDFSEQQLEHAIAMPNIRYVHEAAEQSSLSPRSVDLITVATAIHWFDKPKFFAEVNRVLRPDGLLFVWSYGGCKIEPEIDTIINHFNFEYLLDYWHDGAKENWNDRYQSLHLPFIPVDTPNFTAKAMYTLQEVMNYMFSWSGVQNYIRREGKSPLEYIAEPLEAVWGDPNQKREVRWPLHSKCSRKQIES